MSRVEFCTECDLTLDLHPQPYDEDDPGCDTAEMKARVLGAFDRMVFGIASGR